MENLTEKEQSNNAIKKLQQENGELKNELDLYKTWYRAKHDDVKNCLGCYRKALEAIKEYTRTQFCDNCEDIGSTEYSCHCEYCEYQEYFDIISKAKGEGNKQWLFVD